MPTPLKLLAFDTSTDRLSVALSDGARLWQHSGPGGAQASTTLIPAILALLAEAGLALDELDAIAFGRGPGSFTGLRTACAVAQGLAFGANQGAGIPVLPVDTLMALAEEARFQRLDGAGERAQGVAVDPGASGAMADAASTADASGAADAQSAPAAPLTVTALLDARMDEMYVQAYEFGAGQWRALGECALVRPEQLQPDGASALLAGNVFGVYAGRLPQGIAAFECVQALPLASAMLRLAPALVAAGHCVEAAQALPLYVRDKVALTTEERAQVKRDAAAANAVLPVVSNSSQPG